MVYIVNSLSLVLGISFFGQIPPCQEFLCQWTSRTWWPTSEAEDSNVGLVIDLGVAGTEWRRKALSGVKETTFVPDFIILMSWKQH